MSLEYIMHVWCPKCQGVSPESTFPHDGATCASCNAIEKGYDLTTCKQCPSCRKVQPFRFFQHYVPERLRGDNPNRIGNGYTASAWQEGVKCAVCAGKTKEQRARRIPKMSVAQLERAAQTGAIDPALLRVGMGGGTDTGAGAGVGVLVRNAMDRDARRKESIRMGHANKRWAAPWKVAAGVVRKEIVAIRSKEQYQSLHPHDTHDQPLAAFIATYRGVLSNICKMLVAIGSLDVDSYARRQGELHLQRYNLAQRREDYRRDGVGPAADDSRHAFKTPLASAIMTPHSEWEDHVLPAQMAIVREGWALLSADLRSQRYRVPPMLLNKDRRGCMGDKPRPPPSWELHALEKESRDRLNKSFSAARTSSEQKVHTPIDWDAEFPGTE